ncbi:hypothetical protein AOR01nite_26560 [Acetobacter orleanensis]|uniref:Phosphoribosyltransferase domain-containing protein n=1 Tax=Acetobacter orleanensis TaxID=104099 RepID=A0A4Y3TRS0_9PROT|nr:hypothetical protein Abol_109_002 [Acetobacter orleanensis JCM 7639]GEB84179.1 hypothetical protein AOR01nite_26560 [Acetobacter orleanensis]
MKWVLQFDKEDYPLAVQIIEHLDVLGSSQIRAALEVAHTKLVRSISNKGSPMKGNNTLFAAVGKSAKSGALIAYHYRVTSEIPESSFISGDEEDQLDLSKIENIVLVDDVIGTGRTITSEVSKMAEEVYSSERVRNIFVLTVAGYESGINHVEEKTGSSVITALEYGIRDTVADLDAVFYHGMPMSDREDSLETIKRYCRSVGNSELGFANVGGLLVFDHNTPNTTLPIIWSNSKNWLPLFPRAANIPGSAKVIKSVKKERSADFEKKDSTNLSVIRKEMEITLFVEGKIDEIFIDYFVEKQKLSENIEVGKVNAIALGGLYQSQKLIDLLQQSKKHAVFVLDNDAHAKRAASRLDGLENVPVMFLKPNFIALLDINKIYANKERFPSLPEEPLSIDDERADVSDDKWLHALEKATIRRGAIVSRADAIIKFIDEFLDEKKYEEFCKELKEKINVFFPSLPEV